MRMYRSRSQTTGLLAGPRQWHPVSFWKVGKLSLGKQTKESRPKKAGIICEHLENCITHIRILYAQIDQKKWLIDSDDGLREVDSGMSGLLVVLNEKHPYWREKLEVSCQSEPTTLILPPVCHNPRQ